MKKSKPKIIIKNKTKGKFFAVFCLIPSLVAAAWSIYPTVQVVVAIVAFDYFGLWTNPPKVTSLNGIGLQRIMQQYFSRFDIFIPLDDIVVRDSVASFSGRGLELNSQACNSDSKVSVWLPYRLRMPFVGEYIWEHCWIPQKHS